MIRNFDITGFRCFKRLSVTNLARVNLFVGQNNSGKTSLLEAFQTLIRRSDPIALDEYMSRRGEILRPSGNGSPAASYELDVRRLFHGHSLDAGSFFLLSSDDENDERTVRTKLTKVSSTKTHAMSPPVTESLGDAIGMEIESSRYMRDEHHRELMLSTYGGVNPHAAGFPETVRETFEPANFVSIDSTMAEETAEAWGDVALTEGEKLVEQCLRLIEPSLERVAYVMDRTSETGGFRVKLKQQRLPVPIGSMGAGTWRLLVMAIALARSRNGYLFIDEIDTGLHHLLLPSVWSVIVEVADYLNVQVFATTHSLDCVRALGETCESEPTDRLDRVAMHRIEKGSEVSIHYSERQIVIAAERGIETR